MLPSDRRAALAISEILAPWKPLRAKTLEAASRICVRRVSSRWTRSFTPDLAIPEPRGIVSECSLIVRSAGPGRQGTGGLRLSGFQAGDEAAGRHCRLPGIGDAFKDDEGDVTADDLLRGHRRLDEDADADDLGVELAHQVDHAAGGGPTPQEIVDEDHAGVRLDRAQGQRHRL